MPEGTGRDAEDHWKASLFLAGDALITVPWSHVQDQRFLKLVAEMRAADVTIVNLETVIHDFKSHAQPESGGTYMASPPMIAGELRWAGVDMASGANNHAFDYGTGGVLETLLHGREAGLILSGIGEDLQTARAPAYCDANGSCVALVSMAATFIPYARASRGRPDMRGRPGINPLNLTKSKMLTVSRPFFRTLTPLGQVRDSRPISGQKVLHLLGMNFRAGEPDEIGLGKRIYESDRIANLKAIREAKAASQITVVAIHAHGERRPWLRQFARHMISEGADIVQVHGPHAVRGIEAIGRKIIFYGMGDFVYQPHLITRFPSEAYDRFGLSDQTSPSDLTQHVRRFGGLHRRQAYESFASVVSFQDGELSTIRLLPLDLQFDAPNERLGTPLLADADLGRQIIGDVARRSRRFGTRVLYDAVRNEGVVDLGSGAAA